MKIHFATVLSKLRNKDTQGFKELVCHFSGRLMTVAKMMTNNNQDAQDVLQEGFISIYQNFNQFEGDNEFALYAWMKKIVINKALAMYKRKYYSHEIRIELKDVSIEEPEVYKKLESEDIMNYIYQLPVQYRQVVCLFAIEGFSHNEIATLMEIKESTSRSHYSRAKKKLHKIISSTNNTKVKFS